MVKAQNQHPKTEKTYWLPVVMSPKMRTREFMVDQNRQWRCYNRFNFLKLENKRLRSNFDEMLRLTHGHYPNQRRIASKNDSLGL